MTEPDSSAKQELYRQIRERFEALAEGLDTIGRMSTLVALIHHTLPNAFWTGFYRVVGEELVIGPYQGSLACLRIAKGRGVCGAAWETGASQVVPDVHAFPGHIACDSRSNSEIVIPVRDDRGAIVAVLDLDSTVYGAFDEVDRECLEEILRGGI